jgi:predicted RNA-binding Zn ribbon-like protein
VSVRLEPLPLPALVDLVNGWGTVPTRTGHRSVPPASALRDHIPAAGAAAGRADATAVADRLYAVFAGTDPAERADAVTAMLRETAVQPELATSDDGFTAAWRVPRSKDALLASAALALRDHCAAQPNRLGTCADRQCSDVYVDASPAGHRRFCSLTCQNRARAATFRDRRRQAGR